MSAESITIHLEFFAQFREDRGVPAESIRTGSRTAAELYEELNEKHHFRTDRETSRVAVNDALASWETALTDGDTVVFLSPFGGG